MQVAGTELGRLDREVGAREIADEQRVAAQQHPRLHARSVADHERQMLGPVAGRRERPHPQRARRAAPRPPQVAAAAEPPARRPVRLRSGRRQAAHDR